MTAARQPGLPKCVGPWGYSKPWVRQFECPWLEGAFQQGSTLLQHENFFGVSPCGSFCKGLYLNPWPRCMSGFEFQRLSFGFHAAVVVWPTFVRNTVGLILVISSLYQLVMVLNETISSEFENLAWRRKGRWQLSKCFQLNEYTLQKMFDRPTNPQEEREKRGE